MLSAPDIDELEALKDQELLDKVMSTPIKVKEAPEAKKATVESKPDTAVKQVKDTNSK